MVKAINMADFRTKSIRNIPLHKRSISEAQMCDLLPHRITMMTGKTWRFMYQLGHSGHPDYTDEHIQICTHLLRFCLPANSKCLKADSAAVFMESRLTELAQILDTKWNIRQLKKFWPLLTAGNSYNVHIIAQMTLRAFIAEHHMTWTKHAIKHTTNYFNTKCNAVPNSLWHYTLNKLGCNFTLQQLSFTEIYCEFHIV